MLPEAAEARETEDLGLLARELNILRDSRDLLRAGESAVSTPSRLAPAGRARAPAPQVPSASGQRERYKRIAQGFFGDLGMAAGGDHYILFSVCGKAIGHRCRVSAVRQLRLP